MPYTPPTHRSPASSAPSSPDATRRSSFSSTGSGSSRPALPRSASYIAKHRRAPSASASPARPAPVAHGSTPDITPPGTSDDLKGMLATHTSPVRQSPPPVADSRAMPPGAIISPPESSSEDEGVVELENRGRNIENLKELQDAISSIPQHRQSSPSRASPGDLLVLPSQVGELVDLPRPSMTTALPPLDTRAGGRKVSHTRSQTDTHVLLSKMAAEAAVAISEESSEQDDEPMQKPQMVRKKSGELVRPALRPAAHRRPSSMPGTPTFSKAVHFDSHLEHVRHFLQVDRPLAVSANTSPNDNYESDTEYPFGAGQKSSSRSPTFEWELVANNFPPETPLRKALPARVERVWMSNDQKSLIGSIAVANLAFQKSVVCRFTFDYWKTTSEVAAEYSHEIRPRDSEAGCDRFQFTIKLSDIANLESKTLFFCVRYNVNGREYWDNNDYVNFQVDFRKKIIPQSPKKGPQGTSSRPANALPRSNRRSNPSTMPRPKSMPMGVMDEFGQNVNLVTFDQPIHEFLGESRPTALRLKSSKSTTALPSDNLARKLPTPSGQAFHNRYDFGASLSAAKQANKRPDALYMKPHTKTASFSLVPSAEIPQMAAPSEISPASSPVPPVPAAVTAAPAVPGTDSPSSVSIASASYEEILNKYCFFNGSKQSSPQLRDGTLGNGRYDGMDDFITRTTNSTNSSSTGSPTMAERIPRGALHHSLHQSLRQNLNPYFQNTSIPAIGASPVESPLQNPSSMSAPTINSASGSNAAAPRSASPASLADFAPFAGTSSSGFSSDASSFVPQSLKDRFPFTPEAHSSPPIKG